MNTNNIFLTGATGHLGSEIVKQLLTAGHGNIYVLMRQPSTEEASNRLRTLWWEERELRDAVGKRVHPILGDITKDGLGVSADDKAFLRLQSISHIVHCAAETSIAKSREHLWQINVKGTENMLGFVRSIGCEDCPVAYVSTAYVAGRKSGIIKEDAPLHDRFFTLYEESKAEAEKMVRKSGLKWIILRPGMIVGHSDSGRTRNFNTVYYIMKLLLQGKMRIMPISSRQTVNIVPVDYVAKTSVQLLFNEDAIGKAFHLTLPHQQLPQAGQLIDAAIKWAEENLNIRIKRPLCIPVPALREVANLFSSDNTKKRGFLHNLLALMPYFYDNHQFDRTNTDRLTATIGTTVPEASASGPQATWHHWLPAMLSFACRQNFMQLTPHTIFEQSMVRRESKRYPITYYNISARGITEVTGKKMNTLVHSVLQVLHNLQVKPGDRIAVTGINCTEQAAIDCAIGLAGAVSVPIYYTTPAAETQLLLEKSGATLFFVGDQRMMLQLANLTIGIPVITFADATIEADTPSTAPAANTTVPEDFSSGHCSLQELIAQPAATLSSLDSAKKYQSTPAPDALSTIRYTSGTTGEPKGVMFSFSQLKWMGQVLTNLLSWHDRNSEMRYLSFLPMSHVVEGILAAYAPYCMLCKVKFYYLNDFAMLTQALPQVRPTVFFSVPRFYEKLWEQIEHNSLGKHYISMSDGPLRRFIGHMLKKAVLRKAGLDRCAQLIVGSAPMSEELMRRFRDLGIEIHNAYGQTEAPLITINRLGDNVIPSIGTPLPDTIVHTSDDGELLVEGPQVAMGYYNLPSDTFRDGILHTGDLGEIDSHDHICIRGRKKDMLITSYGKNINCSKIEQRLTDISVVTNAVLIGEQRPYCCALLWTEGDTTHLQQEIDKMNATLSHPEQVKRWCIIHKALSIANGELTPNLKVRRNVVIEHFRKEVDALYE